MSCSSASHSVPRCRSSAASPLPIVKPQVSPGSKSFNLKPLPFVMRNGSTYFSMRLRISFLAMVQTPFRGAQSSVSSAASAKSRTVCQCLLLTQSGHERLGIAAAQTVLLNPIPPNTNPCCNRVLFGVVRERGALREQNDEGRHDGTQ